MQPRPSALTDSACEPLPRTRVFTFLASPLRPWPTPARSPLLQERRHTFLGIPDLTGGGHHLDGVGVRVVLGQIELMTQRPLAERLALGAATRRPVQEFVRRGVEVLGWYDAVDQTPLERGRRIDHITGQRELHR